MKDYCPRQVTYSDKEAVYIVLDNGVRKNNIFIKFRISTMWAVPDELAFQHDVAIMRVGSVFAAHFGLHRYVFRDMLLMILSVVNGFNSTYVSNFPGIWIP